MKNHFADRMRTTQRSFIREILKVTERPEMISFAGGLPNPRVFPVGQLATAAVHILEKDGRSTLQYSTTEGYLPLRKYISDRYRRKKGLNIPPDDILITSGSQQGLDLLGKIFINKGDTVILERPGYLGSIQAFSLFEPRFLQVPLLDDGIATKPLEKAVRMKGAKLFYAVPNFQNPSGISYSLERRKEVAAIIRRSGIIFIEDDPYGELRFLGKDIPPVHSFAGNNAVLLGTFSKIVAPGLRLGWICASKPIMEKLIIAKQAADLHSNILAQRLVYQHLMHNDLDDYLVDVKKLYRKQRDLMVAMIDRYFPEEVRCTKPEGGMFLWAALPKGCSAMKLLERSLRKNVAFVPGDAFFTDDSGSNTFRLNFSNSDERRIEEGIKRLAKVIKDYLARR